VRPLTDIAGVATDIAGGTLHRRLPSDPDLEPLVTSFNDMVTNLQHRIERDERFASDVSHELRSPLSTLRASVDVLASYKELLPATGKASIDTLGLEIDRFSGMVQDLLEIARIDAGAPDLNMSDVPLDELVLRSVAAHDPPIPVRISPEANGVRTVGDKRRLQRVIANLLNNADFHAGGAVLVTLECHDGWATLAIEDAGPGIPPSDRGRVFDRFYRGAASGRRGSTSGTGLGLALVAEHVHAHDGMVSIGDRPGGGSRFIVVLKVSNP
jgi:signal transduction histidine kinase